MSFFPTRILLATDGSETAARAARVAVELAEGLRSELHVVHVGPSIPLAFAHSRADVERVRQESRALLSRQVERIREAGGDPVETHLRLGEPAPNIVEVAGEIDAGLIVMGSRGLGGIRRTLLGSVSDAVIRHARCNTMIVHDEDER